MISQGRYLSECKVPHVAYSCCGVDIRVLVKDLVKRSELIPRLRVVLVDVLQHKDPLIHAATLLLLLVMEELIDCGL